MDKLCVVPLTRVILSALECLLSATHLPLPVCEVLYSVCLFVCLFICLSVYLFTRISQKPQVQMSPNFFIHVTYGRGSVHVRQQCDRLCISGFVDDVMFWYNRANGQNQRRWVGCFVQFARWRRRGEECRLRDKLIRLRSDLCVIMACIK